MYILNSNVIILDLDDKFKALVNPRISDGIKIINKIQFDLFELILKGEKIKDIEYFLCVSEESILKFIQSLVRKNIIYEAEADVCSSFKKENFSKSLDFWIHITDLCNLKCSYCFLSSDRTKGNTMEDSTIDLFIQKLTNVVDKYHINRLNIRFAGGEPLLKFDVLKDIYSKINNKFRYKLHITYSIISNLTNITSEVVSFLIQNDISIGFSIDGIGDFNNINRLMKNGGDSFSLIQKNIDLLIDAGVNKMGALVVVSDNNLDGLLDLVHFFVEKRLSYRLSIVRNAKFNYEKAIVVFKALYSYLETIINCGYEFSKYHKLCDIKFLKPSLYTCSSGINSAAIDVSGNLYFCPYHIGDKSRILGNMSSVDDLFHIIERGHQYINPVHSDCINCSYLYICTNGCPLHLENGKTPSCLFYKEIIPIVYRLLCLEKLYQIKFLVNSPF